MASAMHPTRWVVEGDRIMDRNPCGKPFWMTVDQAIRRLPDLAEMASLFTGSLQADTFRSIHELVAAIQQATGRTTPPAANVVDFSREGAAA